MVNYLKNQSTHRLTSRSIYSTKEGFTIVELLVVIVVIGILAAVAIVSYNAIHQKAIGASLSSDLSGASTRLKMYQIENMAYPTLINSCPTPAVGNICLKFSPGNILSYSVVNTANPQTYSLTATNTNGMTYVVTQNSAPTLVAGVVSPVSQTFNYTSGATQSFTVPAGVTSLTLECWGGSDSAGDKGGYAKGTLAVTGGDVLNIYITGSETYYDGVNSSISRPAAARLLWATGGYDTGHDLDYDDGYGYVYAGLTNTSVSGAFWTGSSKAVITYTPAS